MNPSIDASHRHVLLMEEGLERLMGDRALYLQLLRRFRQNYQTAAQRIRLSLQGCEVGAGRRLAHTLKGAAGMIGAQQAYACALALETSCSAADGPCMEALAQLEQAMSTLLGMIDNILDSSGSDAPAASSAPAATPPSAQLLVQQLARLLDEGDGAAIDILEQSASILAASLGLGVFQEVAAAAHQFDFEAALQALTPKL